MAIATFLSTIDMSRTAFSLGTIGATSPTQFTVFWPSTTDVYSGHFTYVGGAVSGTIDSFSSFSGGSLVELVTGLSLDASIVTTYAKTAQTQALTALEFGGDDRITSTVANSVILGYGGNDRISVAGGGNTVDGGSGSDTVVYSGHVSDYITKGLGTATQVTATGLKADTLVNVEKLQFSDYSINTAVTAKALAMPTATVDGLVELYVAYFNRVPEASGLDYWLTQLQSGRSLTQISKDFYAVAVQTSGTGITTTMSNADFISLVYNNVLGRNGANGPTSGEVAYWDGQLSSGASTKDTMIADVLKAAHSFKGDPNWGWVANLLDNKIALGEYHALTLGLDYLTPAQAIAQTTTLASQVTSAGYQTAVTTIGLDGFVDMGWSRF